MPLDTGAFQDEPDAGRVTPPPSRPRVGLDPNLAIGQALKVARQRQGLTLADIAETTRVRERHLEAIEAGELAQLPSRPFTIGYVRAYAKALGVDADATISRYRTAYPSPDDDLHGPVGVRHDRQRRGGLMLAVLGAAGAAVLGWNVFQHVTAHQPARASAAVTPRAVAIAQVNSARGGAFNVDAPLPAPPEATAPAPYITPVVGNDAPLNAPPPSAAPAAQASTTPFVAQGAVYGDAKGASPLIIQARKSISLEVRGPGGVVYFARQLAAGEAYRVPALPNLTAEVSNPASAELFEGGVSEGLFTAPQIPLKTGG
ncbi:MAG TPA: helix-turn-helix domain-containing protein [Caulobacteraceae bacterium]|jgi:transcriptional regulator with XRE-family HTH domain